MAVTRHVSPVSVTAGRLTAESQVPLKVSGQKLLVKAPTSSSTQLRASLSKRARELLLVVLIVWFLAGFIVAAEQIISLPENFWITRRL